MTQALRYLFWPNPGFASYTDPDMLALLLMCAALVVASFALGFWRRRQSNPITRKLSASWSSAAFWFGIAGLVLVVSRVEDIQFVAMRVLWVVWAVLLLLYVWFQSKRWRTRHYEVLPKLITRDARSEYLPKKKKR
jgi:peptidoglycan/LPS O-acetylase OafA/YrhL